MEKEEKKKKPKSKARKIFEWIFTIFFVSILLGFSALQIYGGVTKKDNFNVPSYFGYSVLVVQTDSMEPDYAVKSTVFVQKVDPKEIKLDDDLTFFYTDIQYPMTHRCSKIETPEESGDGLYYFTVHGINKDSDQCKGDCTYQTQRFSEKYLIGKVVGKSVFVGAVFNFLTEWYGLLTLLLIPTMYLVVSSLVDIAKALKDKDEDVALETAGEANEASSKELGRLSVEDKKRLKEELLNEMLEEKGIKKDE